MDIHSDIDWPMPGAETFETLHASKTFTIERIASNELNDGEWYDQEHDEWVILLQGQAVLEFKDRSPVTLKSGEHLFLPKHLVHRVKMTSADALWLAVHGSDQSVFSS